MKLSDFDFDLPQMLIAQMPAKPRNHARLLVYNRQTKAIADDHFYNLDKYLNSQTTLVLNNSKVEKARLRFGNIEIFVIETINPTTIRALVRPGKKFQMSKQIDLSSVIVKTIDIDESGLRTLSLSKSIDDKSLDKHRLTPFPPYIAQNEKLANQYQTVYADPLGSKAAPTAGLHFTKNQLTAIKKRWPVTELTLHVGLGTFAPVKSNDIAGHKMHHEWFEIGLSTADVLNKASHITAVGTTSARTLESLSRPFTPTAGKTDIFITPGYQFKNVDALITNFHLPKSTLLMMVAALIGSTEELHRIYKHAIDQGYRFYSFGDAICIL